MYISVIGSGSREERHTALAYEVGKEVARRGHVLVCGGMSGVMEAAARGAHDAGGVSVGILPGHDRSKANRWLTVSIPTDMGHARNAIVALAGDALIAIHGGYGTLSELAFGLKMGKPVIAMETWDLGDHGRDAGDAVCAATPAEAVDLAETLARKNGGEVRLPC